MATKRRAERQLTDRDDLSDEGEIDTGIPFEKASAEVLATRKKIIGKRRRGGAPRVAAVESDGGVAKAETTPASISASTFSFTAATSSPTTTPFVFPSSPTAPKFEFTTSASSAPSDSAPPATSFSFAATPSSSAPALGTSAAGAESLKEPTSSASPVKTTSPATPTKEASPVKTISSPPSTSAPAQTTPAASPQQAASTSEWPSFSNPLKPASFSFSPSASTGFSFSSAPSFNFSFNFTFPSSTSSQAKAAPTTQNEGVFGVDIANPAAKGDNSEPPAEEEPAPKPVLVKQESQPTGEEDEDTIFNGRCKLYEFKVPDVPPADEDEEKAKKDDGQKRWCESGVGTMRLNKHKTNGNSRLVMRTSTGRLILNSPLISASTPSQQGQQITISLLNYALAQPTSPSAFLLKFPPGPESAQLFELLKREIPAEGAEKAETAEKAERAEKKD